MESLHGTTIVAVTSNKKDEPRIIALASDHIATHEEDGDQEIFSKLSVDPKRKFVVGFAGHLDIDVANFYRRMIEENRHGRIPINLAKKLRHEGYFSEFKNVNEKTANAGDGTYDESRRFYAMFVTRFRNRLNTFKVFPTGDVRQEFLPNMNPYSLLGNKISTYAAKGFLDSIFGFRSLEPVVIGIHDAIFGAMGAIRAARDVDKHTKGYDLVVVREDGIFPMGEYLEEELRSAERIALRSIVGYHRSKRKDEISPLVRKLEGI